MSFANLGLKFRDMKTLKKIFQTLSFTLMIVGSAQTLAESHRSETRVIDNVIRYAQNIYPIDRGGYAYPMALVGGNVRFEGEGPVYVTLRIGGQSFSALTDNRGDYSFFAYTNGAGRFEVNAWVINGEEVPAAKKVGKLSAQTSVQK